MSTDEQLAFSAIEYSLLDSCEATGLERSNDNFSPMKGEKERVRSALNQQFSRFSYEFIEKAECTKNLDG